MTRGSRRTAVVVAVVLGLDVLGLALHPTFSAVTQLRFAAPAIGVVAGAALAHRIALLRAAGDAARDVDPGGRALFLGLVMVVGCALAWLAAVQALPSFWTAAAGARAEIAATVVRQVPEQAQPDCRWRLEVRPANGERIVDLCVDEPRWQAAQAGQATTGEAIASPLGAEILDDGS